MWIVLSLARGRPRGPGRRQPVVQREEDRAPDRASLSGGRSRVRPLDGRAARPRHRAGQPGPGALQRRRDLPRDARGHRAAPGETICFETFIYWSGSIGRKFADALGERARAGVKVHVVLDWVGSGKIDESHARGDEGAGVEVVRYHPLRWYSLGRLNNRTHRKLLVVDGRIGFTGGVGIADNWLGHAQDPEHWRDSHFRIEGPAVAQMQAAFMDNWIETCAEVLHGEAYFPPLEQAGQHAAQFFKSSADDASESVRLMYLLSIASAVRSVRIANAYFVPDSLAVATLVAARRRGASRRDHRAQPAHRLEDRAPRFALAVGAAARGGRRDLRVPAHHVPLEGGDRGRGLDLGGLHQLRQPLVPAERRGQPQHLRRRVRRRDRSRSSRRTSGCPGGSRWRNGAGGRGGSASATGSRGCCGFSCSPR